MLNKKVEEALNAQINAEMCQLTYNCLWRHIAMPTATLVWVTVQVQFQEEQDHAKIMFNYIIQRGGHLELKAIDAVPTT